jgi:hypothetical protein
LCFIADINVSTPTTNAPTFPFIARLLVELILSVSAGFFELSIPITLLSPYLLPCTTGDGKQSPDLKSGAICITPIAKRQLNKDWEVVQLL